MFREKLHNVKFTPIDRFNYKWLGKLRFEMNCSIRMWFHSLGLNCVYYLNVNHLIKKVRKKKSNSEKIVWCFRMFDNTLSSFDLQSIECDANSNVVLPLGNDSLLAEEWCDSRTISHFDRIEIIKSKTRNRLNVVRHDHLDWTNRFSITLFSLSRR